MGFLQSYGLFLLKHPGKILAGGITFVLLLFTLTLILRHPPSFRDPLVGFEARDTPIAARLNAWKLLMDETSASANNLSLTVNSPKYEASYQPPYNSGFSNELGSPEPIDGQFDPPQIEMITQQGKLNKSLPFEVMDQDEEEYYQSINSSSTTLPSLMHHSLGSSKAFCGKLYDGYAQVVISQSTRHASSGLFNLHSMLAICQLDKRLRLEHSREESVVFQHNCEQFESNGSSEGGNTTTCCNSWSLPNIIACLSNKTTCMSIDGRDLKNTELLLNQCAPYYFKNPHEDCFTSPLKEPQTQSDLGPSALNVLSSSAQNIDHWPRPYCGSIPDRCLKCNGWIFTVLNYLTNENFVLNRLANESNNVASTFSPSNHKSQRNSQPGKESIVNKLTYTNIFLPMAKSSSLMSYYGALSKYNLKTPYAQVKAMDLGLKNSLFEHLISDDTKLFVIALMSILFVISIYTWSTVLSFVILMIICLSLCLSYSIYELVFNIPVFPFMNLLAVVISFGICSDNAMLFCKHWTQPDNDVIFQANGDPAKATHREQINLDRMLKRAIISTLVATLATALSFVISAISKVIAVRCFCIFATLSVITNYLLVVLLLPPALILDSRFSDYLSESLSERGPKAKRLLDFAQNLRKKLLEVGKTVHRQWIFHLVTTLKLYLIITFVALLACASILVFHRPTMQPSEDEGIQLLSSKHAFEQYDKHLRKQFAFELAKMGDSVPTTNDPLFDISDTLPVRVVFGIEPVDNGNHLDPNDRGSLVFDHKFDITDKNAQIWLLDFCHKLRQQRFIHPSPAPDLTNCFMDTFKSWMDARSCKDPIRTDIDRSPCCQSHEFPYSRHTFNKCVGEAVSIMRKTPQFQPNLNAGVRFFKNSTKVAALIIEYQSNRLYSESFTKMERFFNDIDSWVTWQINNTAPPSLKSGWFITSNIELLSLQTELEQSTLSSILLEVVFATLALMAGTRDLVLTFAGTVVIGTIIIVTVAALILMRWTLGVAESILISLTIGLSIDFALHYTVAYSESRMTGSSEVVIHKILDEVGSPIALATITTSLAGFVIVWSDILAYQELGMFLMLIAFVSWLTSTFFLLPVLATMGSILESGNFYARVVLQRALKFLINRL